MLKKHSEICFIHSIHTQNICIEVRSIISEGKKQFFSGEILFINENNKCFHLMNLKKLIDLQFNLSYVF